LRERRRRLLGRWPGARVSTAVLGFVVLVTGSLVTGSLVTNAPAAYGAAVPGRALAGVSSDARGRAAPAGDMASVPAGKPGYLVVGANGAVSNFGVPSLGDLSDVKLAQPIVGAAATPGGAGYWLVASDGGVFAFGDARFYGSMGARRLNKPIVAMAAGPGGRGYWFAASDGGIFAFGDARFYGSMGARRLNEPIVGMAATPNGRGYWLVASDGGVFAFGDARFYGSMGARRLNEPIVGMAATPNGRGYWLVASDGGIFAFGDANFYGSTGSEKLPAPIAAMAVTANGKGYWLAEANGLVSAFGDAPLLGSAQSSGRGTHVVAVVPMQVASPARPPAATTTTLPTTTTTTPLPITTTPAVTTTTTPYPTTTVLPTTTTTVPPTVSPYHPYVPGTTGYDASWPQCAPRGSSNVGPLPANPSFAIVGVNDGTISGFNSCFAGEAAWAGQNLSVYIILQPAPSTASVQESSGPDASCAATSNQCQGFDWGYNYAKADLAFVQAKGFSPKVWWLDIETGENWPTSPSVQPINAAIIQGALTAVQGAGDVGGIYSTWYQWGEITGSYVLPGLTPLWVPGADAVSGGELSAQAYCQRALMPGDPSSLASASIGFAGGSPWLVQYGYGSSVPLGVDPDYACG